MVGSGISLVVFTAASWLLVRPLGVPGLGVANTIALAVYAALLTIAYGRMYGLPGASAGPALFAIARQLVASAAIGWGLWLTRSWLSSIERTGLHEAIRVAAVLVPATAAYVGIVLALGGREPTAMMAAVRRKSRP
jgi:peptidoglycan biosynthesis protein MviN/MurJ (putative lipid II flippase)